MDRREFLGPGLGVAAGLGTEPGAKASPRRADRISCIEFCFNALTIMGIIKNTTMGKILSDGGMYLADDATNQDHAGDSVMDNNVS
jgi:hypothetical protein